MRLSNDQNYNEAQFLQYVMYVLKTSRSKRHAESRLQGLLSKRLATIGNLIEFTPDMIEEYLQQENRKTET